MRKATEPQMTAAERAAVGAALSRLGRYSQVEADARKEVDRLMEHLWKLGVTDHSVAAATGLSVDTVRMRRRRHEIRKTPERQRRAA